MISYLYVAAVLIIGLFLYARFPLLYVSFTWYVWLLTPEIRRVLEYQTRYDANNPAMLSPFLVTGITLLNSRRIAARLAKRELFPFALCMASVMYAFLIGVVVTTPTASFYSLLNWLTPILFSVYLFSLWPLYPRLCQTMRNMLSWGVLITGAYGLVQFTLAPAWDRYWMSNVHMTSIGTPEPYEIRVFSTLNSPAPFAVVTAVGLLLTLTEASPVAIAATMVGSLAFLLSLVRQAWGGWAVGFCTLLFLSEGKKRWQLLLSAVSLSALVLLFAMIHPFSEVIKGRFHSLNSISTDTSFHARSALYGDLFVSAFINPVGAGLGSTGLATKLSTQNGNLGKLGILDSGVLDIAFSLGWLGGVPYLTGLICLFCRMLHNSYNLNSPAERPKRLWPLKKMTTQAFGQTRDETVDATSNAHFVWIARAAVIATIAQLTLGNTLINFPGLVCWTFLGFGLAANKYAAEPYAIERKGYA